MKQPAYRVQMAKTASVFMSTCVFLLIASLSPKAADFPDTLWMNVTFYDYHADESCPEFQPVYKWEITGMVRENMVADTLDSDGKPVLGSRIFFNRYIHKWFRPWMSGDFTAPYYPDPTGVLGRIDTLNHDTSFKNIVVNDSLPFIHTGNGMYTYDVEGFFPLDNRGFGNEPYEPGDTFYHNYSFAMEMNTYFTYRPNTGMRFEFRGDDDVWVFINKKLALDIGGIHGKQPGSFHLDSIADEFGLEDGKIYSFDFFYAERNVNGSNIKVTTNLFSPISSLKLYGKDGPPNTSGNTPLPEFDTATVGEPFTLYAHLFDSLEQWKPEYGDYIEWTIVDSMGNPVLSNTDGPSTTFTPTKAHGTVTITATFRNPSIPDAEPVVTTITLYIKPGKLHHIDIYPNEGQPSASNQPYPSPPSVRTISPDTPIRLVGKVFDQGNVWLKEYEEIDTLSNLITWSVIDPQTHVTDTSVGRFSSNSGHNVQFFPRKAYRTVDLVATIHEGVVLLRDTIRVRIEPGHPAQMTIEASTNPDSTTARPIETLNIYSTILSDSVYAIIRDSLGNFIDFSKVTTWGSLDNTVATVNSGRAVIGEGIVGKNPGLTSERQTRVYAFNTSHGGRMLTDTITVRVLPFEITALRIVTRNGSEIESLLMSTNEDTTLFVEGLRSDGGWIRVNAQWEIVPATIRAAPNPPAADTSWSFSPIDTGSGHIRVSLGDATPDQITFRFLPGAPTAIAIELITPSDSIRVDYPIRAIVRIQNRNGFVPGMYCDTSVYQDKIGRGTESRPGPISIVDGKETPLNLLPGKVYTSYQCFNDGIDTVVFKLYNAPFSEDSTHQITVNLGNLTGKSRDFVLLPGPLDKLVLELPNYQPAPDTITLHHPDGFSLLFAAGLDRYGNRLKEYVTSNWNTTGTLQAPSNAQGKYRLYYTITDILNDQQGHMVASASDDATKRDSVYIVVHGPKTEILHAITRDTDGNGYLDQIELQFDREVTVPANYPLSNITIKYGATNFSIGSITKVNDGTGKTLLLNLHETGKGKLQTAWKPSLSITDMPDVADVTDVQCSDGAGPVIVSVTRYIDDSGNREEDEIRVILSERIETIPLQTTPYFVFNVWEIIDGDTVLVDTLLDGIGFFQKVQDTIVIFRMKNGKNISTKHLFNIEIEHSLVSDIVKNEPVQDNRKVRVKLGNQPKAKLTIWPNPAEPSPYYTPPGIFIARHDHQAPEIIRSTGGTVIGFRMTVPGPGEGNVAAYVKIYDFVGNLVISGSDKDITRNIPQGVNQFDVTMYWNGFNKNGMKVSPGIYRAVVYLDYESDKYDDVRLIGDIGIKQTTSLR